MDVKATDLNVAVKSFKPVKEVVQKGDSVVLDLDLSISKKHVTPNSVMINGKEYTLYKSVENIFDRIMNTNRYKVSLIASDIPGIQEYNMSYIKMSDNTLDTLYKSVENIFDRIMNTNRYKVSLIASDIPGIQEYNMSYIKMSDNTLVSTDNTASVNVLKSEPKIKNFVYEKKSVFKKLSVQFAIEDVDNTTSDLRIELYKDNKLLKTEKINNLEDYYGYFNTDTNGTYELTL